MHAEGVSKNQEGVNGKKEKENSDSARWLTMFFPKPNPPKHQEEVHLQRGKKPTCPKKKEWANERKCREENAKNMQPRRWGGKRGSSGDQSPGGEEP